MGIYGREFAAVYNESWAFWGPRMWPFLSRLVARRVRRACRWLDLCCGTGSLLKLACENGFEAVGVDGSPHQLRFARRNAPAARLVRSDVRSFDLGETFDVVTCLFDSLNYLTRKADLARAFRSVRRHLARGGLFVFDVNTRAGLRTQWRRSIVLRSKERTIINETTFNEKTDLGRCVITGFVRAGRLWRRFEEEHIERGYDPKDIEALLARAGFVFSKLDGHTFARKTRNAARLLYICRHRGRS